MSQPAHLKGRKDKYGNLRARSKLFVLFFLFWGVAISDLAQAPGQLSADLARLKHGRAGQGSRTTVRVVRRTTSFRMSILGK